ncbi:unnamed protein product [Macrosiphum euphorbiae]|uniref:Uncharacterized protein n=1 Tax=Macrosiphum euphorbiae TaxID=13131 RepID=A0AAV0Y993_9HEMI|nr:unnamed protein product [Macrosiphum euphorbiae]
MAEALVSRKDTCCSFINNGDDLLTLKKIVSKKTDIDGEIQKLNKSVDTNGSEFNGNHNKTDSIIHFDVDNTSSLEPNFEMDNDTDRNITIGSICTQEDRESEAIYISNENSNDADVNNGEIQKLNKSVDTNGSELNGNHNKTDSIIHFDVDNTSSLEPNFEMDNDTDRNITIGSICTQEDRESETIYISNENSNDADVNNGEIQKLNKSVDTNGSELNGNHNKTDSIIHFDVDNTSSLEPNFEMGNDTDRNITIGSICTQEDRESETIYISNENSNDADVNNGEKDIQVTSIKCLDVPYSQSGSLYDNDSHDLQDDYSELNNIGSPASYFNISARAPLRSYKDLDTMFEGDHFLLKKEVLNNKRKRKFEDLVEQDQKSTKLLKLWNLMKYPFKKITYGTSISENKSNISKVEIISENENTVEPESAVCENNGDHAKTEEETLKIILRQMKKLGILQ